MLNASQTATAGLAPMAQPVAPRRPARPSVDRQWDTLLVCLALYSLTAVGRLHQLFPLLSLLKPVLLSAALALVIYLFAPGRALARRPALLLRSPPMRCMLGLLAWAVLSIPGGLWVSGSFHTVTDVLLKAVLMALVVAGAVRGVADVERLAGVYFAGIALYAGVVLAQFNIGGDASWRLDHLYYYDANDFSTLAVTALPIGLYFAIHTRGLLYRGGALLGVALLTIAFVWSGSRGGFLAALAVGGFVLVAYSTVALRWRIAGTLAVVILFAATGSDAYWEKMRSLLHPEEDYNLESSEGRKAIWKRGIGYMLQYPVLGVGAGNFPTAEGTISAHADRQALGRGVKWQAAHNSFVQIGAELGIPGLLLFVGMILATFRGLAAVRRRRPPPGEQGRSRAPPLAQALTAALVGYVVGAFFLSLGYAEMLYLLVALAAGLRKVPSW